ncbi:MAG: MBL fold metallo-hydrolase [Chitinispirillaceae bacterium]|nr:MBL fold metallo-hydrolase [Chitinispirillaceae bacterium]
MNPQTIGYEVDFLPVGDGEKCGDAIALRFGNLLAIPPEQNVVVIDGGFKDSGTALVKHIRDYYKTFNVDVVISTHPDNDHASGLEVVLTELNVGNLLMHLPWNHTQDTSHMFEDDRVTDEGVKRALRESLDTTRNLEKIAKQKNINIMEPFCGLTGFNKSMRVLGPTEEFYKTLLPGYRGTPEPKAGMGVGFAQFYKEAKEAVKKVAENWGFETLDDTGETSAENNSSTIILFTIGEDNLLFTGDAGIPALSEAIGRLQAENFNFSTMKFIQVPHHGSRRNIGPTLLNTLIGPKTSQPTIIKTAIASVSPDGAPKHPAKKVTNAFLRRGAPVHITAGNMKCQYENAPSRGWSNSVPLPFYNEVEE